MQHIHVNNGNTFLLIEISETAEEFEVGRTRQPHVQGLLYTDEDGYDFDSLPTGNWQLISKANVITEEQAKEIVQLHPIAPISYKHYEFRVIALNSAKESFNTLLRSHSLQPQTTLILKKVNND